MEKEETKNRFMNRNIKILPSYLALTWDVLFVWTISIMYFTDVKGLSYSQTVALDSILMIVGCVFCLLFGKIFQRVSPLKATQLSNFGFVGYLLLCIFGQNFFTFIVAQFFLAYAYALKSIKDNLILTESLSHLKRDKEYQRIYGKGLSYYYIMDAIGAVAITYVYEWKPEASYWLALVVVAIAEKQKAVLEAILGGK